MKAGTYRVDAYEVTGSDTCKAGSRLVTVDCDTTVSGCNIRIKAVDSQQTETDVMPRVGGVLQPLLLSVEHLEGASLAGYTYQWTRTSGTGSAVSLATTPTVSATSIGEYAVKLMSGTDTCTVYLTVRSKPCTPRTHTYACGTTPAIPLPDNGSRLSNLAPGDTIRAADFDIIVTEVTGGGSEGWNGVGYAEIPYLQGSRIAIELKGVVINDCYELVGGTAQSAYDPSWGSIQNVDQAVKDADAFYTLLKQRFDTFSGKLESVNNLLDNPLANSAAIRDTLVAAQAELDSLLAQVSCLSEVEKNDLLAKYNQLKAIGTTPAGGRLLAKTQETDWKALGNQLSAGFDAAKSCTVNQIDIVLAVIQQLRQNTEFGAARSHATTFKLSGDGRCAQMFTEGFLNELLAQIDVKSLAEEIQKALTDNIRQIILGEHKYQDLLDCFSPKFAVTGDLSNLQSCSDAIKLVLTDLVGGSAALYNQAKDFAAKVYGCQCLGNISSPIDEMDDCAYSTGKLTAFTLAVLAPGASKFAKIAKAFSRKGITLQANGVKSVAQKIQNGQAAQAALDVLSGVLFENQILSTLRSKLASGEIKRAFPNMLSIEEEAVVKFYTTNEGYTGLSKALRGEIPITEFYDAYKQVLS